MEKRSKLINFIKAVFIIACAFCIVAGAYRILIIKSEDGINQFEAFYKNTPDTIDVLFLGSSRVYCDISTGVLWDNYGIAAFDLGGAEAPAWVSYYQLKEALQTQKPKVVLFEVSVADDIYYQKDEWAVDNNYGMRWDMNRIEQLRVNSEGKDFRKRLNPYNIMHGRYKDIQENDFRNVRNTIDYKGFDPRESITQWDTPDTEGITEMEPVPEKVEEYVKKIIELTKENEIPIILFLSPYCIGENDQRTYNYIGSIAESEGVEFLDFNKKYDEMKLDFASDIADGIHLNYSGNYKFSDYLGRIIKEKYDIPDRRGDEAYDSWERDAIMQRYERTDLKIKQSTDIEEIRNLAGEGYILFEVNNDSATIFDNNNFVVLDESKFRLTHRSGYDQFLFLDEDNDNVHTCSLFVNDTEYKEEYGNLIFVYDAVRHEFVRSMAF